MAKQRTVWSAGALHERYPAPEDDRRFRLDPAKVPERFRLLIPYAEFWGIPDEPARLELLDNALSEVRRNLQPVIAVYDDALEDWLLSFREGPETMSDEYVAFVAMIMAADCLGPTYD